MSKRVKEFVLSFGAKYEGVIWFALVGLTILPLITTINDLLTQLALGSGLYKILEKYTVPVMVRLAGTVLDEIFKIETVISGSSIFMMTGGLPYEIDIVWNCVGWQSFILLALALVTVLQGKYTLGSRIKCVVLGIEGVVILNIIRVTSTCLLLLNGGYGPAITFHDYFSTVLTFIWLSAFWYLSQNFILDYKTEDDAKPLLKKIKTSFEGLNLIGLLPDFIYGKKAMGLATMVIILLATFLNGVAILSVRATGVDQTILNFEHLTSPVTVNTISTSRIMTMPEFTQLNPSAYSDPVQASSSSEFYEMWNFYLYGPLGVDYSLQGSIIYTVWLKFTTSQKLKNYDTQIRFKLYDVDETGESTLVNSDTFDIRLKKKMTQFQFTGSYIDEHVFDSGHTLRLSISIYDDRELTYVLEYDSSQRHSNIDLPGMVVPENLTNMIQVSLFFATTSVVSGHLRATLKRRREQDE
jgi:exosortase/archaeosortase family protein